MTTRFELTTFPRPEFVERRFDYRPGEMLTIIGPTGSGKTVLGGQLIRKVASPRMPALYLVKKPQDPEISRLGRELNLRRVGTWPPPPRWDLWRLLTGGSEPNGWLLWPPTRFDPDIDRPHKAMVFRRGLISTYRGDGPFKKRPRIVVVDDAYGIAELLKLRDPLIENWTEMRAMRGGQWAYFQRPSLVPLWAYQADHLLLFNEPDKRSRVRFEEIGGMDSDFVADTVLRLRRFQALYIRRRDRRVCIVDAN